MSILTNDEYTQAIQLLKKKLGSQDDPIWLLAISKLYAERDGMWDGAFAEDQPDRFSKAMAYLKKAADTGDLKSMEELIDFYLNVEDYVEAAVVLTQYQNLGGNNFSKFHWFTKFCGSGGGNDYYSRTGNLLPVALAQFFP